MKEKLQHILLVIIVLYMSGGIGGSTSPIPNPTHQYVISGSIIRENNKTKNNFQVMLAGKSKYINIDSLIDLRQFLVSSAEKYMSITDTSGNFSLSIKTYILFDSLAIKVVAVDRQDFFSDIFPVPPPDVTITSIWHDYPHQSGCKSCVNEPESKEYISGYRYNLPVKNVILPY